MFCDNAMVQEADIDPVKRLPQFVSDGLIMRAWERVAARVVVGNHQTAGIAIKTLFDDFSRVNGRLINRSPK